jgi:Flp pilus assembly CpaF family ATPase
MLAHATATANNSQLQTARHWSEILTVVPDREEELDSTAKYMEGLLDISSGTPDKQRIDAIDSGFWSSWDAVGSRLHNEFREYLALRYMKKEIKNIVFGYGPLEDLLRLPSVSEIMVVDREHVYIERNGVLENSGKRFISDEIIETIIQRIVARVSRRIDKSQPLVDARLSDGSRVNAVIAPLAVSGPTLTIRKFPYRKMLIDDLVANGALTRTVAEFLRAIVLCRRNILISGGTGTGKTTLLNCLSDFIPDQERIVTVEDTAELQLNKEHVVRMETKEANVEGTGEYTIRDLVRNALRMRPDRIVVGECRGPEALDMLQAMNTGHDGSLTTIHANTSADVLRRLEVLVQMAADLPVSSIHQQISSAIDIIVQLKRLRDGRRVISQISECTGVNPRTNAIELRDLYLLENSSTSSTSSTSTLQATGRLPTFIGDLIQTGTLNLTSFYHSAEEGVQP